jgi:SAM-dependent methyltransferase
MKERKIKECMFCSNTAFRDVFKYTSPPIGETGFTFFEPGKYKRKIIACGMCGHYYSTYQMDLSVLYSGDYVSSTYHDADGMKKSFDRIISLDHSKSDNHSRCNRIESFLQSHYPDRKPASFKVLDVGSGLGVFPYEMAKRGYSVTALDPDPLAAEHICTHVKVPVLCKDFFDVDFHGTYDLITFNKVLEHVESPDAMLQHSRSFLKKNGIVYVELPDGEIAENEGSGREEFFIEHLHVFSFISVVMLANQSGFTPLIVERLREPSSKFTIRLMAQYSS